MASQHRGDDGRREGADRMKAVVTEQPPARRCPRCNSESTKFCYYNNYSQSQPRYFCKACRRYWTQGGALRNIPVGGSARRYKRPRPDVGPTNVPHQLIVPSSTTAFSRPPPYFFPAPTTSSAGPGFFSSLVALQSANQLDPIQTFWDNNNFLHGINYFGTGDFTGQKPAAYLQMPRILIAGGDDDPWNTNAAAGQDESADEVKPDLPGAEGASNEN